MEIREKLEMYIDEQIGGYQQGLNSYLKGESTVLRTRHTNWHTIHRFQANIWQCNQNKRIGRFDESRGANQINKCDSNDDKEIQSSSGNSRWHNRRNKKENGVMQGDALSTTLFTAV